MHTKRAGYRDDARENWPPGLPSLGYEVPSFLKVIHISRETLVWAVRHQNEIPLVYKLYKKRGPISWVREHLCQFRVEREFHALSHLARQSIPCSRPVYWTKGRDAQYGGRHEVLVTEEIPDAIACNAWLKTATLEQVEEVVVAIGGLFRDMHESGFYHGALYTRNVLLDQAGASGCRPYIIDVPQAIVFPHSLVDSKLAKMDILNFCMKLRRHFPDSSVLTRLLNSYGLGPEETKRFLSGVAGYRPSKHTRNVNRAYAVGAQWGGGIRRVFSAKPA